MSARPPIRRGLYAITPTRQADLACAVAAVLRGRPALLQYRAKLHASLLEAMHIVALCHSAGVPCIVNDDAALASAAGAAGVHLGRHDGDPASARQVLGPNALIGVSCYDSLARAEEAVAAGADYIAFGSFFCSATKPGAVRADANLLRAARRRWSLPLVAIGGITPDNGALLVSAGADLLAASEGVFAGADIEAAARRYSALLLPVSPTPTVRSRRHDSLPGTV